MCGAFGLGGNRDQDAEGLRRMYEHLEPGGTLVLDNEVPYNHVDGWQYWTKEKREELPGPWPDTGERRAGSDGTVFEMRGRMVELDPLAQRVTVELRGSMWRDGRLVEQDEHVLKLTAYFTHELQLMLERAAAIDIELRGDHTDDEPTIDSEGVVFIARKPG